ncbi:MAG: hypothetical protein LBE92_05710 [Chryseobacterium sp.]|uniref:hypothetical protein n=1 Tax=Chryseobacterium sp. TaxID=1871047 RepID=UPI0028180CBD|nr:hypothetical protein [Chryseobacterium sp.]MDR2235599.1 hypothetical protein [Chryseobacterium sp.]
MKNLKIIFIHLFFILMHSMVSGQAFKLEELASFNSLDMDTFKKEIKKQNYTFYDKTEGLGFVVNEYDSPGYLYKITKFEYQEDKSQDHIEFTFKDKKDYDAYLKAVLGAGYQPAEKGKIMTGESYTDYYKNKKQIRIVQPKKAKEPYTLLIFK